MSHIIVPPAVRLPICKALGFQHLRHTALPTEQPCFCLYCHTPAMRYGVRSSYARMHEPRHLVDIMSFRFMHVTEHRFSTEDSP